MQESNQNRPHLLSQNHCSSVSLCQSVLVRAINALMKLAEVASIVLLTACTHQTKVAQQTERWSLGPDHC
jgi:hypothetical protein